MTTESATDPKKQKRGFKGLWLPAPLLFEESLCPSEKILAIEIDSLDSDGSGCTASNPYLANFLNIPEGSLRKHLYHLRDMKIIKVSVHKKYRRTMFSNLEKWCLENPCDLKKWVVRGEQGDALVEQGVDPIDHGVAPTEQGDALVEQKVSSLSILSSKVFRNPGESQKLLTWFIDQLKERSQMPTSHREEMRLMNEGEIHASGILSQVNTEEAKDVFRWAFENPFSGRVTLENWPNLKQKFDQKNKSENKVSQNEKEYRRTMKMIEEGAI